MLKFITLIFYITLSHPVSAFAGPEAEKPTPPKDSKEQVQRTESLKPTIFRYVYRSPIEYTSTLIYFDIYQPGATDSAVLLDAVVVFEEGDSLWVLDRLDVERFSITEKNNFHVEFKGIESLLNSPPIKQLKKSKEIMLPRAILFSGGGHEVDIVKMKAGKVTKEFSVVRGAASRIEGFTPKSYQPYISLAARSYKMSEVTEQDYQVREPGVIHGVPYKEYFSAKGIDFPNFEKPSLDAERITLKSQPNKPKKPSGGSYQSQPGFQGGYSGGSSYKAITSAKDLKLGEALKGKEAGVFDLMNSTHKPTVADFVDVMGGWDQIEGANPFSEYFREERRLVDSIKGSVPEVIVQLEMAYPNAIYYGLGRDIYLLSDALDAYYVFHRQEPNRIRRLHASHPSFNEKNIGEVQHFLESNGFEFTNVEEQRPRIIFDITSYSKGFRYSQSSQLMRAAYHAMMDADVDPEVAFAKVNFVSVSGGPNNIEMKPGFDFLGFFDNLDVDIGDDGPTHLLRTRDVFGLSYPKTWHGIYSRFKVVDGKTVTEPGALSSTSDRLFMLGELWTIAREVKNASFQVAVELEAFRYLKASTFEECKLLLKKEIEIENQKPKVK